MGLVAVNHPADSNPLRDPQFKSVVLIAVVDETDAVALRRYSGRGTAVAARRTDNEKSLRRELSQLLQRSVVREASAGRGAHRGAREKGAERNVAKG